MKLLGLAALFASGVLVAGAVATVGGAQTTEPTTGTGQQTTTETVHATSTVQETTTVQQTATVVPTTTTAPATTPTTTSTASTSSGTPTWVWVLLGLLGAAVVGLLVVFLTRRGGAAIPASERQRRLQGAVESWIAQGWALLSATADTAVLQRGDERMAVSVDQSGQITTRQLTKQPPA
jgi:hypothetical protein